jgi:hypothetical protein
MIVHCAAIATISGWSSQTKFLTQLRKSLSILKEEEQQRLGPRDIDLRLRKRKNGALERTLSLAAKLDRGDFNAACSRESMGVSCGRRRRRRRRRSPQTF